MNIAKMKMSDYPAVYSLWIHTPGMGLNTVDDSPEGIAKYLKRNPKTCFVAKERGAVVGVILSGHDGRRGFIHHTAVACANRNRGIGTALVQTALDALRKEGITKVAFVVFRDNGPGNAFWEKLGFTARDDLIYRNRVITDAVLQRIDT